MTKIISVLCIIIFVCTFFSGCQELSDKAVSVLESKCNEVLDYFNEIALYPDFNEQVIARWERPIHIKIDGDYTDEDYAAVTAIVDKLNSIEGVPEISIVEEVYNCYMDFSPQHVLEQFYYYDKGGWWMSYIDSYHGNISSSRIGIATDVTTQTERNYIILVTMTSTLGLRYSSDKYPQSVFYSKWNDTQALNDMDIELIRMLYSPVLHAGMNEEQEREALMPLVKVRFMDGSYLK